MTRRTFLKKWNLIAAGVLTSPFLLYAYTRYAEPQWIKTNDLTLFFPRLPANWDGLKIVQFSDVHLGFVYEPEHLIPLVNRINLLEPDVICFTGDLFDSAIIQPAAVAGVLSRLKAKLGKWAVLGNHDYYANSRQAADVLIQSGFQTLHNESAVLERSGAKIWITGVEDMMESKPDLKQALSNVSSNEFVILLSHAPDFADTALKEPVDLQLSGHSHGGQVRLPFYGHVITPPYARKYVDGYFTLGDGKLQLYVNRGIGVSVQPFRFWCRPELTVITLKSGDTPAG